MAWAGPLVRAAHLAPTAGPCDVGMRHNDRMTFPLGSLRADGPELERPGAGVGVQPSAPGFGLSRLRLVLTGVLLMLAALALLTHHASDPGFSTSGAAGAGLHNKAGVAGAWLADVAYFTAGFSVWWLWLVAARSWGSAVARSVWPTPGPGSAAEPSQRVLFWAGLLMLLAASCALEWTRLYRLEAHLPGPAGGVLGHVLGSTSMRWLGFAGSGVFWIAFLVAGASMALRFSWVDVADRLGARMDGLRSRRQERRELEEDARIGEQALRERELQVQEHKQVPTPVPLVIEPVLVDVPKSDRVAKERQQPLFKELTDTRLPQVDLLDAAPARQESVTADSLEMTSRLIEKKLGDFGVVVRVVAATPGPVITRYEIEPDTGVKGSQVVNLATDLPRSHSRCGMPS